MRTTENGTVSRDPPRPHQPALDHARKIGAWAIRALAMPPEERRRTPALALHDHVVEYHVAVVTLAERQVFGAMQALLRPMVDRHLRALWVERLTPDAAARFLSGPDTAETDTLLRMLRKSSRLGDADALLSAWERSPLYHHPAYVQAGEGDIARQNANLQHVPTLDDVVDALNFSTGLALLSTMRMAQLADDGGAEQSARFRLGVMAGVG